MVIALHWLISKRAHKIRILVVAAASLVTFSALLPLGDLVIWHQFLNPLAQVRVFVERTINTTFAYYLTQVQGQPPTRPWSWLLHLDSIAQYKFAIAPGGTVTVDVIHQLMLSPSLWALIMPAVLYAAYQSIKRSSAALFSLCLFAGTFLPWVAISLAFNRVSYVYYFYPSIGAVCIGIALGLEEVSRLNLKARAARLAQDLLTPLYLLITLVVFMITSLGNIWLKLLFSILAYLLLRYYVQAKKDPARGRKTQPVAPARGRDVRQR